ncbi:MAG: hypothetical protein QOD80_2034 [Verrucomicrobiota bacterium]
MEGTFVSGRNRAGERVSFRWPDSAGSSRRNSGGAGDGPDRLLSVIRISGETGMVLSGAAVVSLRTSFGAASSAAEPAFPAGATPASLCGSVVSRNKSFDGVCKGTINGSICGADPRERSRRRVR